MKTQSLWKINSSITTIEIPRMNTKIKIGSGRLVKCVGNIICIEPNKKITTIICTV